MKTIINSQQSLEDYISKLRADFKEFRYLEAEHKNKGKARSSQQNRALHKYLSMLADALNNAGYDMRNTLRHDIDLPWSPEMVKDLIWRPVQIAMFNTESTAKMKRSDYSKVWEVLNRHTSEKFGIYVQWPSEE